MKFIVVFLVLISCTTISPAPVRPKLMEYIIDPDIGWLIGPREGSDLRISNCYRQIHGEDPPPGRIRCYAFPAEDYRSMLTYVAWLEAKDRACRHVVLP